MDYEKKYKEALERMKSWARGERPECFTEAQKTAEFIFPELKESEDERIRKGIFKALSKKDARDVLISQGIEVSDALAWIEKQGEPIDKEKVLIGVRKNIALSIMDFLDRNTLGMCLSNMECEDLEDAVVDSDWSKVYNYMKKKLENQDELRSTDKEEPTDYNSIDPCFGKPIDKREPKFKVGDWISHNTANFVFKVVSFGSCGYEVINRDNYTKIISFDNEDNYHLWTVQDAKDGDVLTAKDDRPFIFKDFSDTKHPNNPTAYCGIDTLNIFTIGLANFWWTNEEVFPATEEQCDLLFQTMKEAGYKWENGQFEEINNKGFVDLGLPSGTFWSKTNLGAKTETDFGLFYSWGDTQGYDGDAGHDFSWSTYKWGTSDNLTKYNSSDGKTTLDNEDDPVYAATSGQMISPTQDQLQELIIFTNHEWANIDGVKGMKFINKNDDTKYIFIPAAGNCGNGSHEDVGSWGFVWSASRNASNTNNAWCMSFDSGNVGISNGVRYLGFSVRGVLNK